MIVRKRKGSNKLISYDAFPKTQIEFLETSASGVTFSLLSFFLMLFLVIWETAYYFDTRYSYRFKPDTNLTQRVKLCMDITVASSCEDVKFSMTDIINDENDANISLSPTWFDLDAEQRVYFQRKAELSALLRERYNSIQDILFRTHDSRILSEMPERVEASDSAKDGCRIKGFVTMNKIKGKFGIRKVSENFQMPLPMIGGLMLISFSSPNMSKCNFSHRVQRFSFEDETSGSFYPLEGDEWVYEAGEWVFKYYISVVPTVLTTRHYTGSRFQYSVSQLNHDVSAKLKDGEPNTRSQSGGIYFVFDYSALAFHVEEERAESFIQFLGRLIGIVGGIFACSGMIHRFINAVGPYFNHNLRHNNKHSNIKTSKKDSSERTCDPSFSEVFVLNDDNPASSSLLLDSLGSSSRSSDDPPLILVPSSDQG